jgi:hypothetical protein
MSLALTIFPWDIWLVYVIVTIIFEAVALGKWLQVPFFRALRTSVGANLLTAVVGLFFSVPVWAIVGYYGGLLNPNPFGHVVYLFTLFGIGSGLIEAFVWMAPAKAICPISAPLPGPNTITRREVTRRCVIVHLIGVPVGLVILLIPAHPYPGLQSQVGYARSVRVEDFAVIKALEEYLGAHHRFPPATTYGEALQMLKPYLGDWAHDPNLWAAAYVADFRRFDLGESKRRPVEWNQAIGKVNENDERTKSIWIIRDRYYYPYGIVLRPDGTIRRSYDGKELGYEPTKPTH